jgi:hypothetical protein
LVKAKVAYSPSPQAIRAEKRLKGLIIVVSGQRVRWFLCYDKKTTQKV